MKLYKNNIEICNRYYGDTHSLWICNLTKLDMIELSFCFSFNYHKSYYDGNHHRINLGFISIYWLN